MTVRSSLTVTFWMWVASQEIPRNIVIAITPMTASVSAAFFACGRRNAGTPFEIASTPVSAVEPDENACRITNSEIVCTVVATSGADGMASPAGHPPRHLTMPSAIITQDDRDEPVGGDREQRARLAYAAEIRERDEQDERDRQPHARSDETRRRRGDRVDAGDHRDHDRHHVVDEQGRGRHEAGAGPDVLLADDVGAAAVRIGANGLSVRDHDDREQGSRSRSRSGTRSSCRSRSRRAARS